MCVSVYFFVYFENVIACISCSDAQPSSPMVGQAAVPPGFHLPEFFPSEPFRLGLRIRDWSPPDSGLVEARNTFAPPVTENSWQEEDSPHISFGSKSLDIVLRMRTDIMKT